MGKKKPKAAAAHSRLKVTPELYEEILLWYVNNPLQHMRASRQFGVSRRTLTGLYYSGCPHLDKPPMKLLVQNVEVRARAARQMMREEELARANAEIERMIKETSPSTIAASVQDAVQARAEEGAVVRAARKNIVHLQALLTPLLQGAMARIRVLERDLKTLPVDELMRFIKDLGKFQKDLIDAGKTNMEMERMLLGRDDDQPTNDLPVQEAMRVLEMSARTVDRLKREGKLLDASGEEVGRTEQIFDNVSEEDDEYADEEEAEDEEEFDESCVSAP